MDMKMTREVAERRATRQNLVRTADRSEKIRTYNYAQASVWRVDRGGVCCLPCVGPRHGPPYRSVVDESSVVYGGGWCTGILGCNEASLGGREDGGGCQRRRVALSFSLQTYHSLTGSCCPGDHGFASRPATFLCMKIRLLV